MPVRIVTDSAADLPADEVEALGVEVVPLSIRFGAEEYTDGVDLSVAEFYRKLTASGTFPETAAPAPGAFEAAFRRQAAAGADAVVCVDLSEGLSATVQSARTAAKALEGQIDVRVVDSRSITAGLGTQVVLACRAAASGASADEVVALLEDLRGRTHVMGALDTLENLKRGGRIGGAQALLGSLLSIKPLVDISSGEVAEAGRARTRRRSLEWLRDQIFTRPEVEHLTIAHGMASDVAEMEAMLASRYPAGSIGVTVIGPTIGTHAGPRVMGLTWVDPA
ncbi:MAG TPA: DegV family protein [Acidimicrobiales bacterium]|nr:DegV family protein [Acidimicrobiales bacterium]